MALQVVKRNLPATSDPQTVDELISPCNSEVLSVAKGPSSIFTTCSVKGVVNVWQQEQKDVSCISTMSLLTPAALTRIKFASDHSVIASCGDGSTYMWDLAAGATMTRRIGKTPLSVANDIDVHESTAAVVSDNGTLLVFDTRVSSSSFALEQRFRVPATSVAYGRGVWYVGAVDGKIYLIDNRVGGGRPIDTVEAFQAHQNIVGGLSFDDAGRRLGSQSFDGTLKIWNRRPYVVEGQERLTHSAPVEPHSDMNLCRCNFSDDGSIIATGSGSGSVLLIQCSALTQAVDTRALAWKHSRGVNEVVVLPNGTVVSCASDGTAFVGNT